MPVFAVAVAAPEVGGIKPPSPIAPAADVLSSRALGDRRLDRSSRAKRLLDVEDVVRWACRELRCYRL